MGGRLVRPDHVPRRDRAHARRPRDAARAPARVPARRLAARHRPGLSGACGRCTTWPTTTTAATRGRGCAAAARDAGWRVDADDVVQRPAAGAGRGGAARRAPAPARARPDYKPELDARPGRGSTRCSSSRSRLEARWLAARPDDARRAVAAGGAREPRRGRLTAGARDGGLAAIVVGSLAAILGVSNSLGYLLPAIIGLESMGIPSPGETALVAAAVLASQGKLEIWLVILIGGVLGDRRRQHRLPARAPVRPRGVRRARAVHASAGSARSASGDRFFERHGPKAVFIGRWIALVRFATAWLAGINRMPFKQFFFWNALGGITWGVTYGLVGYFGGQAAANVLAEVGHRRPRRAAGAAGGDLRGRQAARAPGGGALVRLARRSRLVRVEVERARVDAVAQPGRRGAVVEHVAEVSAAASCTAPRCAA